MLHSGPAGLAAQGEGKLTLAGRRGAAGTQASEADFSGQVRPANTWETASANHLQMSLEPQEKPTSLSICEGPTQQRATSSQGGKRPWLLRASDQLPLQYVTPRTHRGYLLSAHSSQHTEVPCSSWDIEGPANVHGGLTAPPTEPNAESCMRRTMVPRSSAQTRDPNTRSKL